MDFKKKIEELELKEKALSFNKKIDKSIDSLAINNKFKPFIKPGAIGLISIVLVSFLSGGDEEIKPVENNKTVVQSKKIVEGNLKDAEPVKKVPMKTETSIPSKTPAFEESEHIVNKKEKPIVPEKVKPVVPKKPQCEVKTEGNIQTVCDFKSLKIASRKLGDGLSIDGVETIKLGQNISLGKKVIVLKKPFLFDCGRNIIKGGYFRVSANGAFTNCSFDDSIIQSESELLIKNNIGKLTLKDSLHPKVVKSNINELTFKNTDTIDIQDSKIKKVINKNAEILRLTNSNVAKIYMKTDFPLAKIYIHNSKYTFDASDYNYAGQLQVGGRDYCEIINSEVDMIPKFYEYDKSKGKGLFEKILGCDDSKIINSFVHMPIRGGNIYHSVITSVHNYPNVYNSIISGKPKSSGGNAYYSATKYEYSDGQDMIPYEKDYTSVNNIPESYKSRGGIISCNDIPELKYDFYGNERDCDAPTIGAIEAN